MGEIAEEVEEDVSDATTADVASVVGVCTFAGEVGDGTCDGDTVVLEALKATVLPGLKLSGSEKPCSEAHVFGSIPWEY